MTKDELIEALADKEHDSWARWMEYLFSCCDRQKDGSLTIPSLFVERWIRQQNTPYAKLTQYEKESDRKEVMHILPIIEGYKHG